jgi:prevent-host-death family protein
MAEPDAVGVTELRRNLGRYLRRVAGGETIMIMIRGKPVALLVPVSTGARAS